MTESLHSIFRSVLFGQLGEPFSSQSPPSLFLFGTGAKLERSDIEIDIVERTDDPTVLVT